MSANPAPNPAASYLPFLDLNIAEETRRIVEFLQQSVRVVLRRQGAVVGISGGIDSSVVLALCAQAFGPERVLGLLLPERESSPESVSLAQEVAAKFGVETITEEITPLLEGAGCYARRDEVIRRAFPAYGPGWKARISLPGALLEQPTLNIFRLVVTDPDGIETSQRLPAAELNTIIAASNFKQRMRMSMLYFHAEKRNYAVVGTANKNEHDLGFFVKHGDGGIDASPIAHLFKTQVYQLARYLEIPESVQARTPTTDTYPGGSSQEEFFFRIPFHLLDAIWAGLERQVPCDEIAGLLGLAPEQVEWVANDIKSKQRTTEYLRTAPLAITTER